MTPQAALPNGIVGRAFGLLMEFFNRQAVRDAHALVGQRVTAGGTVVELGFGTGALIERLAPTYRVIGLDPSPTMLEVTRRRVADAHARGTVVLHLGSSDDVARLIPSESADAVLALHSFQFWARPTETLAAIHAALRPGGLLALFLRSHHGRAPSWVPNPLAHERDEVAAAAAAMRAAGFLVSVGAAIVGERQ